MEANLEKKNIYLAAFGEQGENIVHAKLVIDSLAQGSNFADFLSDLFGIAAIVSVGENYEDSELVYVNDSYQREEEEVGQTEAL